MHIELCKEFRVTIDVLLPFTKKGDQLELRKKNILDFVNEKLQTINEEIKKEGKSIYINNLRFQRE